MANRWIIFVDTNIFLDFYRAPGQLATKQLAALERHTDRIILGEQVRMEFLKNRQKEIVRAAENIKAPQKAQFPQILIEYEPSRMMNKLIDDATARHRKVKEKIEKILLDPWNHDPVFQSFNRIFSANTSLNLRRPDKVRFEIRNLARKRFALGYPPRKPGDTSVGDAVNWEWIIRCACASQANEHVLIVSRDGDFGATYNKRPVLNDWLREEFKSRVSRQRKIELTDKLSDALNKLDETVTQEDVEQEEVLIQQVRPLDRDETFRQIGRQILDQLGNDETRMRPWRVASNTFYRPVISDDDSPED